MQNFLRRAGLCAALLLPTPSMAQDITLTAREGGLSISGSFLGYDGEFYRIDSRYGPLTIDAYGVLCDGPACPDLLAPRADFRIVGLPGVGEVILPRLLSAFALARGLSLEFDPVETGLAAKLRVPDTGNILADVLFMAKSPEEARTDLLAGQAELILASDTEPDFGSRTLALDALVPVVAPDNMVPEVSTKDLARVLAGEVTNWSEIGGPDMPLVLHGLHKDDALSSALAQRLGRDVNAVELHQDLASLGAAVAADPWAISVTLRAGAGGTRVLPLTDSCGFPLVPSKGSVKSEDYPLTLPFYLLTPKRRLPLIVREFLDFLNLPQAQAAIQEAGFIDRQAERFAMNSDGLRLINAIKGAGEETSLEDLKALVGLMDGADRLSLTFRFQDGSSALESHSLDNLADLGRLIEAGLFKGRRIYLAGFSDGSGAAAANKALSLARAETVLGQLKMLIPEVPEADLPRVAGFGEALPMACDETAAGRRLNRRVEVWLRPEFIDIQPTEN